MKRTPIAPTPGCPLHDTISQADPFAFVGAIATGALVYLADTPALDYEVAGQPVGYWLAIAAAIATRVATFKIPNADPPGTEPAPAELEQRLCRDDRLRDLQQAAAALLCEHAEPGAAAE